MKIPTPYLQLSPRDPQERVWETQGKSVFGLPSRGLPTESIAGGTRRATSLPSTGPSEETLTWLKDIAVGDLSLERDTTKRILTTTVWVPGSQSSRSPRRTKKAITTTRPAGETSPPSSSLWRRWSCVQVEVPEQRSGWSGRWGTVVALQAVPGDGHC